MKILKNLIFLLFLQFCQILINKQILTVKIGNNRVNDNNVETIVLQQNSENNNKINQNLENKETEKEEKEEEKEEEIDQNNILLNEAKKDIEALKNEFNHLEFVLEIFSDKNRFFCPSYIDGLHLENSEWKKNCWDWFNLWVPVKNWLLFLNVVNNPYAGPPKLNLAVRPIFGNIDNKITLHEKLRKNTKNHFYPSSSSNNFEKKQKNLINIIKTFEEINLFRGTKKNSPKWLNREICEIVDTWILFYRKYEGKRRCLKIGEEKEKEEINEKLEIANKQIEILWLKEGKALSGKSNKFENIKNNIKSPFEYELPEHYFWPRTDFNNLNNLNNKENEKKNCWYDVIPDGYLFDI